MSDVAGGSSEAHNPEVLTAEYVDGEFAAIREAEIREEALAAAREAVIKCELKLEKEQSAVAGCEQSLADAQAELAALEGA